MKPALRVICAVWVLCAAGCGQPLELTPPMQDTADRYLTLLDRGQYDEVWRESAAIFQGAVTLEDWQGRMALAHAPLAKIRGRALRSAVKKTNPANSPPGDYVLITFDSRFGTQDVVETLVLFAEGDRWLLAGYFIK